MSASRRSWLVGIAALVVLPWVLPLVQWVAYYAIWPLGSLSQGAYASAYTWVGGNLAPPYVMRILILMGLQTMLALGLNLVPGFCGLLDLGYIAFYCVGAYTAAILMNTCGLSFWVALPVAILLAAALGVARGFPTLPLSGDYYAIVTFGFAELVMLASKNWTDLTGGAAGFPGIHAPAAPYGASFADPWNLGPLVLHPPIQMYYLMVVLLLVTLVAVIRVRDSRIGRAWFAIREDEVAAESMGVELRWQKTVCFALSAAIGGMAGAFFAGFDRNLHWSSFQFMESIMVLCAVVLGGLGSVRGVLYGTVILVGLTEVLRPFGVWRWIVYGVIMIVVMRFRPAGLFPQNDGGEFALGKEG
jgi:branched-chain amino acid transport system permease protein